jgi:hypothetical protein
MSLYPLTMTAGICCIPAVDFKVGRQAGDPQPHRVIPTKLMGALPASLGAWFVLASLGLAVAGGLYFGMSSCGSYSWHASGFWVVFATTLTIATLAPSQLLTSKLRRIAFLAVVVGTFFVVRAATAPFYPGPPGSMAEFVRLFVHTLDYGPC